MNAKTARLLRAVSTIKNLNYRAVKRAWTRMPRTQRHAARLAAQADVNAEKEHPLKLQ